MDAEVEWRCIGTGCGEYQGFLPSGIDIKGLFSSAFKSINPSIHQSINPSIHPIPNTKLQIPNLIIKYEV